MNRFDTFKIGEFEEITVLPKPGPRQDHALDSVSFMGTGEALANPHLFDALTHLTDPPRQAAVIVSSRILLGPKQE